MTNHLLIMVLVRIAHNGHCPHRIHYSILTHLVTQNCTGELWVIFSDNVKGTIEVCIYSTTIDGDIQTSMLSLSWKWCWIFHPINPCPEQHIRNWTGYSCVIVTNLQFSISLERINQMPLTFPTWGGLPCLYCFHTEMNTKMCSPAFKDKSIVSVGHQGLEPWTPWLRVRCSNQIELMAHILLLHHIPYSTSTSLSRTFSKNSFSCSQCSHLDLNQGLLLCDSSTLPLSYRSLSVQWLPW